MTDRYSSTRYWRCLSSIAALLLLVCWVPLSASADTIDRMTADAGMAFQQTVSGVVTDASTGETIPGVNIAVQGTNTGTATDLDGSYSLTVQSSNAVLVFSYVGYTTERVTVGDQETIDVEMSMDLGRLDEVIVVGYGSVERSDLTGSVDRIDASQFQNQPVTQVTEMLTGTIAGFSALQGYSASGGSPMEFRGPYSLSAGTAPLVVLDGAIYSGDIIDINPFDIESIDILKDASSASVFGSKAASGVILITTSRGTSGAPIVNFNTKWGFSGTTGDMGAYGPGDYEAYRKAWLRGTNPDAPAGFYSSPDALPEGVSLEEWRSYRENPSSDDMREYAQRLNFFDREIDNFLAGQTYDWYGKIVGDRRYQSDTDISVSGGTDNTSYYWSIGYLDNEGPVLGDEFSAIRTRLNADFDIGQWLKIGINAQYSDRDESAVLASLPLTASPYGYPFAEDGSVHRYAHGGSNAQNPLMNYYGRDRSRKINSLFAIGFAELKLPFGIEHRVSFQPHYRTLRDYNFYSSETIAGGMNRSGGYGTRNQNERFEWMVDNLLNWNRDFGVHRLDVTLLHSVEEFNSWNNFMEAESFSPNESLGFSGLHFGTSSSIETNDQRATANALMARVNYNLLDRYLFTASIRRDGFSAFGQENPHAVFPAVAFAWQLSEESFFNVDQINSLKLRLSWGTNGNRDIGRYSAMAQLSERHYYDGQSHIGTYTNTLSNPGLRWEKTESFNVGLDIGLFENRVDLTLDAYDMSTSDLLMRRRLPLLTGFSSVMTNLGQLDNRGFEATLRTVNVSTQSVNWSSTFLFSLNRNEIKSLYGDMGTYTLMGEVHEGELPDYDNNWFIGRSIDAIWDYDIVGIWQESEADEAASYGMSPGDVRARDLDNSGTYEAVDDKMFIGYREPRYRLGFRNDVSFLGNWHASVFIRADLGHKAAFAPPFYGHSTNDRINRVDIPYWTPENQSNEWPSIYSEQAQYGGGIAWWADRSFVRVQDVSLSYSVSPEVADMLYLRNLRIFASARNLLTFTKWPGFDPEVEETNGTVGMRPMPRTFTLGLSLSF